MKNDMEGCGNVDKKKVIFGSLGVVCVLVVLIVGVFVFRRSDVGEWVDVRPVNQRVRLAEVFGEIGTTLGDSSSVSGGLDVIDFGKYDGLERMAIVNTTDDAVNEVWMVKLGDLEQQEDVCRIFGRRVQKLKAGFEDDVEQSKVLDEAVVKQEDGIVIMILSPQVDEIEEKIADVMERM